VIERNYKPAKKGLYLKGGNLHLFMGASKKKDEIRFPDTRTEKK